MMRKSFLILIAAWAFLQDATAQLPQSQVPLADPYILLDGDTYYAYGTHHADGIEYWKSSDLQNWVYGGLALSKANTTEDRWFWAPEVYHKNGQYYMYFSANEHLYVATSDSPGGPFKQVGSYMMESLIGSEKCIDSTVFFDDDGTAYCFFVRFTDGNCIWRCQLEDDYITPVPGSLSSSPCVVAQEAWETKLGKVCEGPFVLKSTTARNSYYLLTYSANDYQSKDYGIGYARANKITNTWTKNTSNPILQRAQGLVGTGHHSFFTDKEGNLRVVFHAHNSEEAIHPRLMYIGSAEMKGSALRILKNETFISPQQVNVGVHAPYDANPDERHVLRHFFDLAGRRAMQPLQAGLYVRGGQKIKIH